MVAAHGCFASIANPSRLRAARTRRPGPLQGRSEIRNRGDLRKICRHAGVCRKKPPHSLILKLDGKGLPGFVKGEGCIELNAKGGETEIVYTGEAQVGGLIASVGQRMLDAAARKIVQQFFDSAKAELESTKDAAVEPNSPVKANRKGN